MSRMSQTHINTDADTGLLSKEAEVFRSKLIADFHLLESINERGSKSEAPIYYTDDALEPDKMMRMMTSQPHGLVRFQVYHEQGKKAVSNADRRRNRVKNKNSKWPPIDLWAHWVVRSTFFQNCILALILINSVVLGVQAEIADSKDPQLEIWKTALDIFDYCTLFIFVLEIILKWLDHFWSFWKNRWNVFDFFITFLSFVPEIIRFSTGQFGKRTGGGSTGDLAVVASNMRTFRVLRSLKMVSRFQKVRLIVLAVTKAFQAMVFITVLLFIFAYIFAIIGVMFFQTGYKDPATRAKLRYKESFSSIINALITLFQLFTLDHWFTVYKDVTKVSSYMFAAFYIILWILIGSFIFRNIFVGIMVNNFQSIRNDLFEEVESIQASEKRDHEMAEFAEALDKQQTHKQTVTNYGSSSQMDIPLASKASRFRSKEELREAMSAHIMKGEKDAQEWQRIVEKNMANLAKDESQFCWPKDSLFRYFLIMETLQENLYERQEIMNLAAEALNQVHDT